MMRDRWRGTRERIDRGEFRASDISGLWERIEASRKDGRSVALPADDPRRRVSVPLLVLLALTLSAGLHLMRQRNDAARPEPAIASDPVGGTRGWLATPAYAQSALPSTLPPIAPPDASRITARSMTYQFAGGADGEVTEQYGTDTLRVLRDTLQGAGRIVVVYQPGAESETLAHGSFERRVDSLVLTDDGRLVAWRTYHAWAGRPGTRFRTDNYLRSDSLEFRVAGNAGKPLVRIWPAAALVSLPDPLVALLPALPLSAGYARSYSVLNLLQGPMTSGYRPAFELRVVGEDSVTVPAGTFACWAVEVQLVMPDDTLRSRLYVDKKTGTLVRAWWDGGNNFFRDQVLVGLRLGN